MNKNETDNKENSVVTDQTAHDKNGGPAMDSMYDISKLYAVNEWPSGSIIDIGT